MSMPSEYSYLYDTADFIWPNTNINTFESGKQIKLTNSGMTPLDITNVTFLAGTDHGGEVPFDAVTLCPSRIISAYITDNGGTVTVNYSGKQAFWTPYPGDPGICYHFSAYGTSGDYLSCQSPDWYPRTYFNRTTSFSNLSACCKYIWRNFAHLYIYYNNELWVDPFNPGPIITYNWQSVPSISGKNGILSLVTLDSESVNDGEPVSGAAVSVFDQAPSTDNNVKDLAYTYGSGEESSAVDVTVKYKVTLPPGGAFSVLKLIAKKDSIPEDATDGDKIVDISPTKTKKTVTGLDENSMYYFKIFAEDSNSNTSESDEKHILTSGDEGYNFDYTGEIVEWTVPKTGIYSLETWGAQGGDATDGTNTARGGYGAYAYGEVLLTQGEKLYINVGGQNGYGGGGYTIRGNSSYIVDGVDSILARYYDDSSSSIRTFYKTNSGRCVRVCAYPSNANYSGMIVLGLSSDDVKYYCYINGVKRLNNEFNSVTVDGVLWFISKFELWVNGNTQKNIDSAPEIDITPYPSLYDASLPNWEQEAKSFIREVINAGDIQI